jgi:hypothetical protein
MENPSFETMVHDEVTFAKVEPGDSFAIDELMKVDAIIIEYCDRYSVLELINKIRSHEDEAIYLMPIFLYKFYREFYEDIARFADGTVNNLSDLSEIAEITMRIKERL